MRFCNTHNLPDTIFYQIETQPKKSGGAGLGAEVPLIQSSVVFILISLYYFVILVEHQYSVAQQVLVMSLYAAYLGAEQVVLGLLKLSRGGTSQIVLLAGGVE